MPAYTECITNKQGHCIADGHPHARTYLELALPRVTVYKAADRARFPRLILNRYRRVTIGAALLVGQRAFSLTWGRARNGARRG